MADKKKTRKKDETEDIKSAAKLNDFKEKDLLKPNDSKLDDVDKNKIEDKCSDKTKADIEKYTEEIEELKKQNSISKEDFIRKVAEFDNFRKRTIKEKSDIALDEKIKTVATLLPVIDTFEKALEYACSDDEFKKGIDMISSQLISALDKLGVEVIDALNTSFNPDYHNAISQIQDENFGENVVSNVCQKGYKIGDKVVRHAMVIVANP